VVVKCRVFGAVPLSVSAESHDGRLAGSTVKDSDMELEEASATSIEVGIADPLV
jgi:hypothetical protein